MKPFIKWLSLRVGKMKRILRSDWLPNFPLGISRDGPAKRSLFGNIDKSFIDQGWSVKMAEYWPRSLSRSKKIQKGLCEYPAILTSRFVNNAYVFQGQCCDPVSFQCRWKTTEDFPAGWFFPRVPSVDSFIWDLQYKATHRRLQFKRTK